LPTITHPSTTSFKRATMATPTTHIFGIRHHGPGSASRLIAALEKTRPSHVLIEGPADCSELLPLLADAKMSPPIALLAYASDHAAHTIYYPFAEFSPEYQACLWALKNNVAVSFIDLPSSIQLAQQHQDLANTSTSEPDNTLSETPETQTIDPPTPSTPNQKDIVNQPLSADPIGTLAALAGFDDGESWWNEFIEQNTDDDLAIFDTIELAMSTLRQSLQESASIAEQDLVREAFMRLEIHKIQKTTDDDIAVVCGAWHAPALKEKHTLKDDRELLKSLPVKIAKSKLKTTWIPWTFPRLATRSGYGAGISSPQWYQHLWDNHQNDVLIKWITNVSRVLRDHGHMVSTASSIETVKLCTHIAIVRNRSTPGFEEIRDAIIACLCFGEKVIWDQIENNILLGDRVGTISDNTPLMPLLEDLQQQQKHCKLKPEALSRDLSVDLRTESGLNKSTLLHRLKIMGIPWGQSTGSGNSRGTFRENWRLTWQPEFSVNLIENLIYGSTIETASSNKLCESMREEKSLAKLAEHVAFSIEATLHHATATGLKQLDTRAAHTSDATEMLSSIAPLVDIHRYGVARKISIEHIQQLINRLITQASLALPYSCRNLNQEEAAHYHTLILTAHNAIQLAELDNAIETLWWQALTQITLDSKSDKKCTGLSTRLLYQEKKLDEDNVQNIFIRALSPAVSTTESAQFFDGFFAGAAEQLLFNDALRATVSQWLLTLEEDAFIEFLPLFRRIFSDLDANERKRMLDTILDKRPSTQHDLQLNIQAIDAWSNHLHTLSTLLQRDASWTK